MDAKVLDTGGVGEEAERGGGEGVVEEMMYIASRAL